MRIKRHIIVIAALMAASCLHVANAQQVSVGLNAFDALNFGAIGLDAGVSVGQKVSLHLGGRYNNWGFGSDDSIIQNRKRTAYVAARYWPWYVNSGWFIQVKGQYNEINSNLFCGRYENPYTGAVTNKKREGDAFGGGIAGGYAHMLSDHFNIEFGLGVWGGVWTNLKTYQKAVGGRVVPDECWYDRMFILPDDIMITITYIF